jgi:hypothetical protein
MPAVWGMAGALVLLSGTTAGVALLAMAFGWQP